MRSLRGPRDERLELVGKMNHRLRFSTSNNLGAVSDSIWQVILRDEGHQGDPAGGPEGHSSGLRGCPVSEDARG